MKFPREIYAIKHNVTKKMYIGSTCRLQERLKSHLNSLRRNKHTNKGMQEDFNNHGENYSFYRLDVIEGMDDKSKEYDFQNLYKTKDPRYGYNNWDRGGTCIEIPIEKGKPSIPEREET